MRFYSSEEYQSSCAELYRKYQHEIQTMLPDAVIEHIGSSSIPMTVSKGDLDILVGVNGTNELGEAVKVLATLGFNEKHGLSKVRNEVNYTHSMGAWFPYSSSQSEHEKMFRLTQLWKQPPSDEFIKTHLTQCDQLLFVSTCVSIVSLCHALLSDLHNINVNVFLKYGAIRLANQLN